MTSYTCPRCNNDERKVFTCDYCKATGADPKIAPPANNCERCGVPNATNNLLTVQLWNGERSPAGFYLCLPCRSDGVALEPIKDVEAFLAGPYYEHADNPDATAWSRPLPADNPFRNEIDYA